MYTPLLVLPLSSRKTSLSPVVGELWRTRLAVVSGGVGREKTTTAKSNDRSLLYAVIATTTAPSAVVTATTTAHGAVVMAKAMLKNNCKPFCNP